MIGWEATTTSTCCARACSRGSSGIDARRPLAALAICLLLAACGPQRKPAPPHPSPVAVSSVLDLVPLDLSPDGEARLLVRLRYADADGRRANIPPGGHVDVSASR